MQHEIESINTMLFSEDALREYVETEWDGRELTKKELKAIVQSIKSGIDTFLYESICEVIGTNCDENIAVTDTEHSPS